MNFLYVALEIETDRVRKLDFYRSIPHCTFPWSPSCTVRLELLQLPSHIVCHRLGLLISQTSHPTRVLRLSSRTAFPAHCRVQAHPHACSLAHLEYRVHCGSWWVDTGALTTHAQDFTGGAPCHHVGGEPSATSDGVPFAASFAASWASALAKAAAA